MILSTTVRKFPWGLSSLNRSIRHRSSIGSQCTSTIRSSTCSLESFILRYHQAQGSTVNKVETYLSHSSSSTNNSSWSSYFGCPFSSPQYTWRPKKGFAWNSGWDGLDFDGGKRRTSLKSIEFSEGGFHFNLRGMF